MKAGISLPRGQLRVDWNLTPRLHSTRQLLHAFHSVKEFSFWNRQIINSKTAATAVNYKEYVKNELMWNEKPTVHLLKRSFDILTCWLARLTAWQELNPRQGKMHSPFQGLLTSRSQRSAQTCPCGLSVIASRGATKSLFSVNLKTQLLESWGVQGNFYFKKKHLPSQLHRKLER